jgi:hypothetical protein
MAEASPPKDPLAITTLDDSPGVLEVSFRLPVPALPSSAELDACNAVATPAAAMALFVAVTREAIEFHGAPASVSRNGVVPSTVPPITALAGASGNVMAGVTAKPGWLKVRPAVRVTLMAAELLLTTDGANCGELVSMLRLRCVSIGTSVVPSGCNWETTRLKSESGLRTPVVCTVSRNALPQPPGLDAATSRTLMAASFSFQAAVT